MVGAYRTPEWDFDGIEHGFGLREAPVAGAFRLVRARQVHGANLIVAGPRTPTAAGDADGLVTASAGTAVAVVTADCVPVLLVAPGARVVAAVHAGWRGSLAGIVPRAVALFRDRFGVAPGDVQASLGPSIGGCCYEVGSEIALDFFARYGDGLRSAWREGAPGKGRLDLRTVNQMLLEESGVPPDSVHHVGPCTACGGADLASFRVQGASAGRQSSWIGLREEVGAAAP